MAFGRHEKIDRHKKALPIQNWLRRCTAQTDILAKASAALPKRLAEPATTPREAPGRIALWWSATPHDISLLPESSSYSRTVHP
ncbi:hypothetical protein N7489_004973 [Penicillium chrysogenum]|uniref:Uncharacterized protein n=1 Tax=Penicillium chrysogenum TaxID=5076 RepID=A0ABQ8WDI3_PENCH|nr:uncharacterized protein N7489_004973 [Penicillium chrysogenum]KAJ5244877.1 hypothetical protein N7489_004973 [Penicillium chrysogenum]KAJ5264682.1 hypothetical protein N7505_007475 [Penicillium chrysogenum]KAJ5849268.1 hypothetical protein N7534_007957 [Penicillium rubens]